MKKLMVISGLLLFISCASNKKSIQQIDGLLSKQEEAWNRGDIDEFMVGYWVNDSLSMMGSSGVRFGYDLINEGYKKGYPTPEQMGHLDFTILDKRRLQSKTYLYLGRFDLHREDQSHDFGYFTLVFNKKKGEWNIVHDHTSAGKPKK